MTMGLLTTTRMIAFAKRMPFLFWNLGRSKNSLHTHTEQMSYMVMQIEASLLDL